MKKIFVPLIGLFLLSSSPLFADTCPDPKTLAPFNAPPAGWHFWVPPLMKGWEYSFSEADYSYNPAFPPGGVGEIVCRYDSCPNNPYYLCPAFTLISDRLYPAATNELKGDWSAPPLWEYSIRCSPNDHNPANCVFGKK